MRTQGSIRAWLVSRPAVTDRSWAARLTGGDTDLAMTNHPLGRADLRQAGPGWSDPNPGRTARLSRLRAPAAASAAVRRGAPPPAPAGPPGNAPTDRPGRPARSGGPVLARRRAV